jgi:hypothetical protein
MTGISRELFEEVEVIDFNEDFSEDIDRDEFLDCLECDEEEKGDVIAPFEWNLMDNEGRLVATMDSSDLWVTGV